MTRLIKFRVFDEVTQEMYYPGKDESQLVVGMGELEWSLWSSSGEICNSRDEAIAMQFTGLKDKNGVEIYEGDILRHTCTDWGVDEKHKVIWSKDFAGFDVYPWYDSEVLFFSDYLNNDEFGEIEVIGNIYQHPNLLEVSK